MIRGFERLGVKNPLTPEQAAEDIVRAVERRELMVYAPLQLAWLVSMLAHVPNVPDFVTRHIYTKNEVGGRRAVAKAEAEGHAIGQTLAYKMRTVDVTRRLSMYKRSEGQENQLRPFDTRKLYISNAVYLIGYPIMQCIQFNASLLPTATNSMRRTIESGMVRPVVFGCYRRSLRKRSGRPASCRRRAPARPCPRWRSWPGGSATARAGASAQTPPSRRVSGPAGRMPDRPACSRP